MGSTDSSSTDSLEGIGSDADSEPSVCVSQPTRATHTIVMICTLFGVLELFGICSILAFCVDDFSKKNLFVIIPFCIVVLGLIITVIIIARQPQNKQELHFKVPLLPWLPFLALFFNVYLILSLKKLTWLRFGIWMAVGKFAVLCAVELQPFWNLRDHLLNGFALQTQNYNARLENKGRPNSRSLY